MRRRNPVKRIALLIVIVICAVVWLLRYQSVNRRFRETDVKIITYQMHEAVPFEADILRSIMPAPGCSLEVTDFSVVDYPDYMASIGAQSARATYKKAAIVTFVMRNDGGNETVAIEPAFALHGVDELLHVIGEDLYTLNGRDMSSISLAPGESKTMLMSFLLDGLSNHALAHIEKYPIYFQITAYPTTKEIRVN